MTISRRTDGMYEGLWRRKGMKPLHLSLRTARKAIARERHDAIRDAVRSGRFALLDRVRSGEVTIEEAAGWIVSGAEFPAPALAPTPPAEAPAPRWGTVDEEAARYLKAIGENQNRADGAKERTAAQLVPFLAFVYEGRRIGDFPFDSVPSDAVTAYQSSMLAADRSPNSVTTYMARVPALWTWAIERETRIAREERRPIRELFSPVVPDLLYRKHRPRERVLTIPEADLVVAATPAPLLWFVACGLLAGLRASEIIYLRPGVDVNLDMGTISVRPKAGWTPKTERSKRTVPMAPSLLEIATAHTEKYANESWMMPSPVRANLPVSYLGVRQNFLAIIERAGLTYGVRDAHGVTIHTLRHTFASHAVMRGVDLYTVSKLLGNTVKMVEDTYGHLSPDHNRAAVARLAGAFTLPKLTPTDTASDTGSAKE